MELRIFQVPALAAAALCLATTAAAQSPEQKRKVDAVFAAYDTPASPGCVLGVIQDGRLIYARGYGRANLEHQIPISPQTVFDIGSTSKQFTAASIVLLALRGKLSLDDDIRKFVPEVPDYSQTVTIRHLLHHTSGLRDYLTLMTLAGVDFDGVTTDDDALRLIARQETPNFRPGDEYLYSNSGFFLLSLIVKRASGKSLREFAQENIFALLGMKHSHFHDDHTMIVPLRATAYSPRDGGGFQINMSGFEQTGDGAVNTTIEDLLLWDQNFYQAKVGGPDMLRQLQTPGALSSGEPLTYALGLVVAPYRGLNTVSHGGSWAGYRAELLRFPNQNFSVACLCNLASTNPGRLARRVAEVFLGDRMTPEPAKAAATAARTILTEESMRQRAGLYRNSATGAFERVSLRDGKLWLDQFNPGHELSPVGTNHFRLAGDLAEVEIILEPPHGNLPAQLQIIRGGGKPETLTAVEAASPTAADLAAFSGTYFCDELDTRYTLRLDGGKLTVRIGNGRSRTLEPTVRDGFAGPQSVLLDFQRDTTGRVHSFTVQAGRVRGITFLRQRD